MPVGGLLLFSFVNELSLLVILNNKFVSSCKNFAKIILECVLAYLNCWEPPGTSAVPRPHSLVWGARKWGRGVGFRDPAPITRQFNLLIIFVCILSK